MGRYQFGLANKKLVSKTHLAARFLAVVELLGRMFGVDQGQNCVQQVGLRHFVIHKKGLRHRAGIGQAGGLDHHAVKVQLAFAFFLCQALQGGTQVFADGAADAAVAHLDDLLGRVGHQNVAVDVFFAELVLNHGDFLAMGLVQDAFEHGGLARA